MGLGCSGNQMGKSGRGQKSKSQFVGDLVRHSKELEFILGTLGSHWRALSKRLK